MLIDNLFLDPTVHLICNADGDDDKGASGGAGGGDPPKDLQADPPPDPAAATEAEKAAAAAAAERDAGWTPEALKKQIDRQHRKIKELEASQGRATELEAENARLRQLAEAAVSRSAPPADRGDPARQPPPAPAPRQEPTPAASADEVMSQARFDVRLEQLNKDLGVRFKDSWAVGWENLKRATQEDKKTITSVVSDAFNTDDPAYVLAELCKDPVKLQDAIEMPSGQRLAAMIKIGMAKPVDGAPPVPRRPSDAPPPPVGEHQRGGAEHPVGANLYDPKYEFTSYFRGNNVALDAEKAADDEWFRRRAEEKRNSQGRPWSYGGKAGAPR
jgi:hypothetical protein